MKFFKNLQKKSLFDRLSALYYHIFMAVHVLIGIFILILFFKWLLT